MAAAPADRVSSVNLASSTRSCCRALSVPGYGPGPFSLARRCSSTSTRSPRGAHPCVHRSDDQRKQWCAGTPRLHGRPPARHRSGQWLGEPVALGQRHGRGDLRRRGPDARSPLPRTGPIQRQPPTIPNWVVASGSYTVEAALVYTLGAAHFFSEVPIAHRADGLPRHAQPELHERGGLVRLFDLLVRQGDDRAIRRRRRKALLEGQLMDEKALNCTPFGLFAARSARGTAGSS